MTSELDITRQMERAVKQVKQIIPNMPFLFVRSLNAINATNESDLPKCPACNSKLLRLRADNRHAVITCHACFWEEYYIRIRKNDNI